MTDEIWCKWCDAPLVTVAWDAAEPKFLDVRGEHLCHPEKGTGPESRKHEPS